MFLALREIGHAKLRYALVTGVIVMVSALVFILSGLANGLATGNSQALEAMPANGFVLAAGSDFLLDRSRLNDDALTALSEIDGVDEAQPISASAGNVRVGDADDVIGISMIGIQPDTFVDPGSSSGEGLAVSPAGVVIDASMESEGVAVGDTLTFEPTKVQLQVVGIVEGHQYRLAPTVFMSLENYQKIVPDVGDTFGAIAIRGDTTALESSLDEGEYVVGSKRELITGLPGYQEQRLTLLLIQVFLVVIAAGIIAAFFFILTLQKMSELGVMKALGVTTKVLASALVIQAIVLSIVGIVIGIAAAYAMQEIAQGTVPFQIRTSQLVLYGAILMVVSVAGTLLSLIRVARVDPLDAINRPS